MRDTTQMGMMAGFEFEMSDLRQTQKWTKQNQKKREDKKGGIILICYSEK